MNQSITNLFVKGEPSVSQIVAVGFYGASFTVDIYDQELNLFIQQNIAMTELSEPITAFSTTSSAQSQGLKTIDATSITGLSIGDRVQIKNFIYRIIGISSNTLTLNKGLLENVSSGDSIDKKGNMGLYKVDLTLANLGDFTLIAKDSVFGLSQTTMVKVVEKSFETLQKEVKSLEIAILGTVS